MILDFGGSLDKGKLIDFVDAGHNLLVAADSNIDAAVRLLGKEHGVEFEPAKTAVIDHFHFDKSDEGDHTLISANNFNEKATVIFGETPNSLLLVFHYQFLCFSPAFFFLIISSFARRRW